MLDLAVRRRLGPVLDRLADPLVRVGVTPLALTVVGLVLGLAAATAAAFTWWWAALGLWLVSRLADGLDGPVARRGGRVSAFGGWADLMADFTVYGAFVVGCAIGQPDARVALLVLLATYYVNGSSLLAYSAAADARGVARPDTRTFHFTRSLAEGTETIVVHSLLVLVPSAMAPIAWGFSALVLATIIQRVALARRTLRGRAPRHRETTAAVEWEGQRTAEAAPQPRRAAAQPTPGSPGASARHDR
ncbi:MAG: CDP-alcohol phosphatidyltransferase family protein [Nitriliruptoraceae bacterium]|nr:CDP-alcohol phosphatidyltransferase family protein [Nitriliruptoraceae bacterium]